MNTHDLQVLAHRADGVEGRPAARLDEVRDRIRTARRRRAAAAAGGAVAAVLAVVIGTTLVSDPKGRTQDPVKPTPTPTETFRIPEGQQTIEADLHPGDVQGLKALATVTNTQPEHRGAAELGTTVLVHSDTTYLVDYCHSADPSVWFFVSFTDGGGGYGRCDEGSAALPRPDLPVLEYDHRVPQPTTVRMFVTRLRPEVRACYLKGVEDCEAHYGTPQPLAGTDAEFGIRVYDHSGARVVLRLFGYTYQALSTVNGHPWIVDRAVVAARGAGRLAVRLPDAKHRWLVGVFDQHQESIPHKEACLRRHGLETYPEPDRLAWERAVQRTCGVRLRLRVDGTFRPHGGQSDSSYGEPWMYAAAGAHEVTVDVTRGDPRNVRYAVIIWRAGASARG